MEKNILISSKMSFNAMIKNFFITTYQLLGFSFYKKRINNLILNRKRKCDHIQVSIDANIRQCELESNILVLGDAEIISSSIGRGSYIGSGCRISQSKIGRFCSIGKNLQIVAGNHPTSIFVSTHPMFYLSDNLTMKKMALDVLTRSCYPEFSYTNENEVYVFIGNDVWIGQNVSIMNGVSIGDGAIIASGATVTKDVLPFSIVGGVPAKLIKMRFNDDTIKYLMDIKWWDKNIDELKHNAESFTSIQKIKKIYSI